MTPHLHWLLADVLPFWAEAAHDRRGGWISELDASGRPVGPPVRHCLTQARMLYVFSKALILTGEPRWEAAARHALEFLTGAFRHPDGGHVALTDPDGDPLDTIRDFYDNAFVLFGLAWWYRATGDATTLRLIDEQAAFLDAVLAHPAGGFRENDRDTGPRRQNPHMHLLEACQMLWETTGEARWRTRAEAIIELFRSRFYDADTGSLREYMTDDLAPLDGPRGLIREPGHHMEWVWLLLQQRRLGGDDTLVVPAERLFAHAMRHGLGLERLVVEEIEASGRVLTPTLLLWPQTELIKAHSARAALLGEPWVPADEALATTRRLFFRGDRPLWANRLTAEGVPLVPIAYTRVLYHLAMAITYHAEAREGVVGEIVE